MSSFSNAFFISTPAGLAVAGMALEEDRADVVLLREVLLILHHAVDPARDGDARDIHGIIHLAAAGIVLLAHVKAGFQPFVIHVPDAGPVFPGALGKAVIAGKGMAIGAHVGCALHVVVAAEDIGAAAGHPDVPQGQLQDAGQPNGLGADVVLGDAHAPDDGAGPVFRHGLGDLIHFVFRYAGHVFHHVGRPVFGLLAHIVHRPDPLGGYIPCPPSRF